MRAMRRVVAGGAGAALALLVLANLLTSASPSSPTWTTALPRPGDRAHYEVTEVQLDHRWAPPPYTVTGLDAEWKPAATAPEARRRATSSAVQAVRV